jgi:hypothetical protein
MTEDRRNQTQAIKCITPAFEKREGQNFIDNFKDGDCHRCTDQSFLSVQLWLLTKSLFFLVGYVVNIQTFEVF